MRVIRPAGNDGDGSTVNLPYRLPQQDDQGNFWMVFPGGMMQQQGRMPITGELLMPRINGQQPNMNGNNAKVGADGEIVLDNLQIAGCALSRHILIDKANGYIRIIDNFRNDAQQPLDLPVNYQSSLNFGMSGSHPLFDPKRKDQQVGIIATDSQNRALMQIVSANNAKIAPTVQSPQGSNVVNSEVHLTIPPGKHVAIMQIVATAGSYEAAQKLFASLKPSKILSDVPKPLRKLIVNFGSSLFISGGNYDILRGDAFDVAEMKTGDQMHGTLHETTYHLNTFYGTVELPADKVISLINIGDAHPRQLLVCSDGEAFGGYLDKQVIEMQLNSGQVTKLPLSQIARLGYHHRSGEPEEWNFDQSIVLLDSDERLEIQTPTAELPVYTRYGMLKLSPAVLSCIAFQNEENGVHEIFLTDGSKFSGIVNQDVFEFKLAGLSEQTVKIPASDIEKLQIRPIPDENDTATGPAMHLRNDDLLIGTMSGQYKLNTLFDTITIDGDKVKSLVHNRTSPTDVVIQLWDQSTLTGQLEERQIACQLKSGLTIQVPVALVVDYHQPQPSASSGMIDRVKQIVAKLNADDWKQRDEAQQQLVDLGPSIVPILQQVRNDQPPEAQQRIDVVLQSLKAQPAASSPQPAN